MCKAKFKEFLENFKEEKVAAGDASWASVVSP
jgi:hypothetical protein